MFIKEKLNAFYSEGMDTKYRKHWTQTAIEYIADGYALGLDENWIADKLKNHNSQAVYKTIISKCRNKLDFWQTQEHDKDCLQKMIRKYKELLYEVLTNDIYDYCIK